MKQTPISSMTAFSRVEESFEEVQVRLEAKSLNHRHLELKIRLPRHWSSLESFIKQKFQKSFNRGIIEIKAETQTDSNTDILGFEPNISLAADYCEAIKSLQKALGMSSPITTQDLLQSGELVTKLTPAEKLFEDEESFKKQLEPLLDQLVTSLKNMRQKEGENLKKILEGHLLKIKTIHQELIELKKTSKDQIKKKVETKINKVFEIYPISEIKTDQLLESRISQELAILIDKTDVQEELGRIESHIQHFTDVLNEGSPIGRKIEFMIQEFHREINTLGNKVQDFEMGKKVIEFKTVLEQMREQVLNVE